MQRMKRSWWALVLAGVLLPGFGGTSRAEDQENTDRKIQPQDVLNIYIVGEKDLPFEFQVSSSGTIQFPFLDMVEVRGKTPPEVASAIKEALAKDYFVEPQVSVSVKQYRKQFVRVMGQVYKAGLVELPSEQRFELIDVISAAGGPTNLANEDKISLTRKGKTQKYSMSKLKEITDPDKKVWVEPNDIIFVGASIF